MEPLPATTARLFEQVAVVPTYAIEVVITRPPLVMTRRLPLDLFPTANTPTLLHVEPPPSTTARLFEAGIS